MSAHGSESEGHQVGSPKLFFTVWVMLAGLTGIEVILGYESRRPRSC